MGRAYVQDSSLLKHSKYATFLLPTLTSSHHQGRNKKTGRWNTHTHTHIYNDKIPDEFEKNTMNLYILGEYIWEMLSHKKEGENMMQYFAMEICDR